MRKLAFLVPLLLIATTYPPPSNYVVDEAGKLSQANKEEMISIAAKLANGNGPEIAVAIVNSIAPETIESYSIKLAEKWKVGKKDMDNGVILVVAVKERKVRIEVGYGLEAVLPDSKTGLILDRDIVPHLKQGDWNSGIRAGFNSIVSIIGDNK